MVACVVAVGSSPKLGGRVKRVPPSSFDRRGGAYVLDWFSGDIGVDASRLALGRIFEVSPEGEKLYEIEKWRSVEGSYLSSVQLRRGPPRAAVVDWFTDRGLECPRSVVQMSGNPTKFVQGHNCYGPAVGDLTGVLSTVLGRLPRELGLGTDPGPVSSRRLDVTTMIELGSHERVHEWLSQAASGSRSRHGRPMVSGSTVYWGSVRRWGVKAYCKSCELQSHPFGDLGVNETFRRCVQTQLRLELTLRSKELALFDKVDEGLIWKYMERVELGMLKRGDLLSGGALPASSLMVYRAWIEGYPVAHELKKSSFYRHRRRILDEVGVDISTSPLKLERSPVVVMDVPYLKAHELTVVPDVFQPFMWRPFEVGDLSPGLTDSGYQAQILMEVHGAKQRG